MYYEINVALHGRHYFATAPRSIQDNEKLLQVYGDIRARFPFAEGYTLSVTYDPEVRYGVHVDLEKGAVHNEYRDGR